MYCLKRTFIFLCIFLCGILRSYSQDRSSGFFNIKDYGATGDGHTVDTKAINSAIAACVKAGGGTVLVPSGTFVTGTFQLFSNMELMLSPGAVILASPNTKDYLMQADYNFSGSGAGGKKLGIIFADKAENVSITGTGTIDGNAPAYMYMDTVQVSGEDDWKYSRQGKTYLSGIKGNKEAPVMWKGEFVDRPGTQIIFHACKKVTVKDITIRNANDWTFDLNACDDVKVLGISIDNDARVPNSDGIDMYDSNNVIVADCDVRAGDDGMAVISSNNVKVTNCNFYSRSCGIRIGYNGFNDSNSGNLLFDNIRIYGANRGIGIFQRRKGNISNMLFSNMIIDSRLYPGQWWGHGEPIHISAVPAMGFKEVGIISNVRFTNIIAKGEEGIVLYGSAESSLKDIRFDNVQLTLVRGTFTDINGGNFDLRPTNNGVPAIFKHDIPAIYAHYVDGLTIKGLDIKWADDLPAYFTNALTADHFQNINIDGLNSTTGPAIGKTEPIIALSDGKGVILKNLSGNDGKKWLTQFNVTGMEFDQTSPK